MEKIQFSCLQSRINPYPNAIPMAAPWYPSNHDGFISFMIKPTHPVRPPITRQKRDSTFETKLSAMIMPFVVKRLVVEEIGTYQLFAANGCPIKKKHRPNLLHPFWLKRVITFLPASR